MMPENNDTIAAVATPVGRGGIGIIRVSGKKSKDIYETLTGQMAKPRQVQCVSFKSSSEQIIDKGLAIYFEEPSSYTGEDVLECHTHGSRVLLGMLLEEICVLGARSARPGEFTERAFLNGKIDLVQAEAIADLIDSHSKKAVRGALQSLDGVFSNKVRQLRERVFSARTLVEAALDFPDEEDVDISIESAVMNVEKSLSTLHDLLKKTEAGRVLEHSPTVVIIGSPNVGKSCLINSLSGFDSAIVSDKAGTTRDIIKEKVLLNGYAITLIDTAGIRKTNNEIEKKGVERAYKILAAADVVLYVIDNRLDKKNEKRMLSEHLSPGTKVITVKNKIDLCGSRNFKNTNDSVYVSVKTGKGMDDLIEKITSTLDITDNGEDMIFARQRHIDALSSVKRHLEEALFTAKNREGLEIMAESMRQALSGFDEVTGKTTSNNVLDNVFSQFCIGK